MIQRGKTQDYFLNLLLIFLLPTQLAIHFWPNFAFVFGIRVDYLAPAIYLTDIIFVYLFVSWLGRAGWGILWKSIGKHKVFLILLFIFALINCTLSPSFTVSFIKWIKLIEVSSFAFYVWARKDIFESRGVLNVLFGSLVFFSLIGILQFVNSGTLGGIFYYLGERSFNILTPGIALGQIAGSSFLRAYSTFPHPNALSGYIVAALLILFGRYFFKPTLVKTVGVGIIIAAFVLTISLSAFVGLVFCLITYLIINKKIIKKINATPLLLTFFGLSLCLSVFSKTLLNSQINFSQNVGQRIELANTAGKLLTDNFLFGSGLNAFIIDSVGLVGQYSTTWLLQPVHNIYLLAISETGIIGGLVIYSLLFVFLTRTHKSNRWGFLTIIFVMVTGLFDHYWFTLQQNLLLLGFLIGISCHSAIELPRGKLVS